MGVLTRRAGFGGWRGWRGWRRGWVAVAFVGLATAGWLVSCVLSPARFPHAPHVEQPLMGCGMCHEVKGASASLPTKDRCAMCHEDARRSDAAVHRPPPARPAPNAYRDLRFSHQAHTDRRIACSACHAGIEGGESERAELLPTMQTCLTCHRSRGAPTECGACHTRTAAELRPSDHKTLWTLRHGPASRLDRARCDRCHDQERDCMRCHDHQRPRDHTLGWRLRQHGLEAAANRSRCVTCHRADACARCHQQKSPPSHNQPGWRTGAHASDGRWNPRMCAVCHQSEPATCSRCHPAPF